LISKVFRYKFSSGRSREKNQDSRFFKASNYVNGIIMRAFVVFFLLVCSTTLLHAQQFHKGDFPYHDYKSVMLNTKRAGGRLNAESVADLYLILNNPNNFKESKPEKQKLDGTIEFKAANGQVVGTITFDYRQGVLNFMPNNKTTKNGCLTQKAHEEFSRLLGKITRGKL
jgi:hypothetical protein